jgi:hypothetical protein
MISFANRAADAYLQQKGLAAILESQKGIQLARLLQAVTGPREAAGWNRS